MIDSAPTRTKYLCPRCAAGPKPEDFSSARSCAFDEAGNFTPDNWRCATIDALEELIPDTDWWPELSGADESAQVVPVRLSEDYTEGWIILSRYKHRGKVSSAVHLGDFWPAEPLTLELAELVIANHD